MCYVFVRGLPADQCGSSHIPSSCIELCLRKLPRPTDDDHTHVSICSATHDLLSFLT